jgi:hypothetical protein
MKNVYNSIKQIYVKIKSLEKDEAITFIKSKYKEIKKIANQELEKELTQENRVKNKSEESYSDIKYIRLFSNEFEFYNIDINLYSELENRTTQILENEKEKFMGFYKQPIISKKNLLRRIIALTERIEILIKLKTPDDIMTTEYQRFIQNLKSFTNKEYGDDTCKAYSEAVKRFDSKEREWYNSKKYTTLCSQLLQYNTLAFEQKQIDLQNI